MHLHRTHAPETRRPSGWTPDGLASKAALHTLRRTMRSGHVGDLGAVSAVCGHGRPYVRARYFTDPTGPQSAARGADGDQKR